LSAVIPTSDHQERNTGIAEEGISMLKDMDKNFIKVVAGAVALGVAAEAAVAHVVECKDDPCAKQPTQVALPDSESNQRAPTPTRFMFKNVTTTSAAAPSPSVMVRITPHFKEVMNLLMRDRAPEDK
jgi:hypothetical protein